MDFTNDLPFFVTNPHAGEKVPKEVDWLSHLPEPVLMRDVDRYVDRLYADVIKQQKINSIQTSCHRYVIDLNRKTTDIDQSSVQDAQNSVGSFPKGLHWSITTHSEPLIKKPMSFALHESLVKNYYNPFHDSVRDLSQKILRKHQIVFHLDLHSMPSVGTKLHPDPGQRRADIVISDFHGQSTIPEFKNLVMQSYQDAGFQVAYNWPYFGGGITQIYGKPEKGHNTIQVELNRSLYMNEETKKINNEVFEQTKKKLESAISLIITGLKGYLHGK